MTQNPLHQRGISIFHKAIKIYLVSHWERPTGAALLSMPCASQSLSDDTKKPNSIL